MKEISSNTLPTFDSLPIDFLPNSVLIDNSTYFSFKVATQHNVLDAQIVYNLSNFLECLVLADKIYLAPTTAWNADNSDSLFKQSGICSQIIIDSWEEITLKQILSRTVQECTRDLETNTIVNTLRFSSADIRQAHKLISNWLYQVSQDPHSFLSTYSGAVYFTDPASKQIISNLPTVTTQSMPASRHLAQYLLRTNFALLFSTALPYHPHSHRATFVTNKIRLMHTQSLNAASILLKDVENIVSNKMSDKTQNSLLSRFGGFKYQDSDLPLILAVVLSGANNPSDILPLALELRNKKEAKRYRKWISELLATIQTQSYSKQLQAEEELKLARKLLSEELTNLYDQRGDKTVDRIAGIAGAVDPEKIVGINIRSLVLDAVRKSYKSSKAIATFIDQLRVKRKIILLLNLAKTRREVKTLNSLLARVFGTQLTADQLRSLIELRSTNDKLIKSLLTPKES